MRLFARARFTHASIGAESAITPLSASNPPICFSTAMEKAKNSSKNAGPASFRNLLNVVWSGASFNFKARFQSSCASRSSHPFRYERMEASLEIERSSGPHDVEQVSERS